MSNKKTAVIMKCVGTTLAICSALAISYSMTSNSMSCSTKKMMKKTVNKMSEIVDAISSFM